MKALIPCVLAVIIAAGCASQPKQAVENKPLPPPKDIYALPHEAPLDRSLRRQNNVTITMPEKIVGPAINAPERSQDAISDLFWEKVGAMQYCYNTNAGDTLTANGKIVLTFTIAPNGAVSEVQLFRTDIPHQGMRDCVIEALEKLQFKPIADSLGNVSVTFPLVFTGAKKQ